MASVLQVEELRGSTTGANANKIIIPSGQTLDASAGGVELPAGVGGKVLQVVQNTIANNSVISSSSYSSTNLVATITPSSTSSKVLAIVHGGLDTNVSGRGAWATLYRDGITDLGSPYGFVYNIGHNSRLQSPFAFSYLDSPNTTNATSYRVYIKSTDGNQVELPGTFQTQGITLVEIAG